MCTNLSCTLRGANELVDHFKQAVGVREPDEVSSDGLFSFEEVECLGACEYAPMMRLDQHYHYDLTAEKVDALIAERRSPLRPASPVSAKPTEGTSPRAQPQKRPRAPRKKKDA
jgi:NADH-quinone oxidoreductase subunit E